MDKERELMKKEILKELIFDRLYRCLTVEAGVVKFDRYELDNADMLYMLNQYDPEKYRVVTEMQIAREG